MHGAIARHLETAMLDLIYLGGTALFFALMLAFVKACEWLGRDRSADDGR